MNDMWWIKKINNLTIVFSQSFVERIFIMDQTNVSQPFSDQELKISADNFFLFLMQSNSKKGGDEDGSPLGPWRIEDCTTQERWSNREFLKFRG